MTVELMGGAALLVALSLLYALFRRTTTADNPSLQAMAKALPDPILLLSEDGLLLDMQPRSAACRLISVGNAVPLGARIGDVLSKAAADSLLAAVEKTLQTGQPQQVEYELVGDDGLVVVEGRTAVARTLAGGKRAVLCVARDVSEFRALERGQRRAQRMEAAGVLASSVAHEFSNVLGVVQGNLELLREMKPQDARQLERIERALTGVGRAAVITRKLQAIGHRQAGTVALTDVNDVARDAAEPPSRASAASIEVVFDLTDRLWAVEADPGDLMDSVLNLTLNARDAMPKGGRLTMTTANVTLDAETAAKVQPPSVAGDYVMIAVGDTGAGMDDTVKDRVFEPFFTTKVKGMGIGLGLSMVHGFAQRSGGAIGVESAPGHGSVFRLFLPKASHATVAAQLKMAMAASPRGSECILVVEDEDALAEVASLHLQGLGYRTLIANGSAQALAMLSGHTDIDLLFADIILPGKMDGVRLAQEAQALRPAMKVLLTSGKLQADKTDQASAPPMTLAGALLAKPYSRVELAQAVRQALDGPTKAKQVVS